ncbi:MAG: lipopolysaccharide kinase InaA family protein [Phycisphaerae bacterium]
MQDETLPTPQAASAVDLSVGARFQFSPIALPGGWSGQVLVDWRIPGESTSAVLATSTPDDWGDVLARLVADPEACSHQVLKYSRTAQVFLARVELRTGPLEIVCKQSVARGGVGQAVQLIRGSRQRRNWKRAFSLLHAGIRTALPRVILERHRPVAGAWLITEAIPDSIDLDGIMSWQINDVEPARVAGIKRALMHQVVELCRRMEQHGFYHRDFKASNMLVTDWNTEAGRTNLWLVDLDGIRRGVRLGSGAWWPAIVRLAASLVDNRSVTRTDGARFLQAYLSSDRDKREAWRHWWRRLARDVQRYNQRARHRKRGKLDGFGND